MDSQEPTGKVTNLLSFLVKALVATILAIAWRRFILLGDKSVSPCRRWTWSMRETKFLLWGIAIGMISLLVVFMVTILLEFLSDLSKDASRWFSNPLAFILSFIAILVLVGYVCGRLSLILPANAIDRRPSQLWINWAWEQAKGNEWPLAALVVSIPFPVLMLLGVISKEFLQYARTTPALLGIGMVTLMYALLCFVAIVQVGILSFAYKKLVSTVGAGQELSEEVTVPASP